MFKVQKFIIILIKFWWKKEINSASKKEYRFVVNRIVRHTNAPITQHPVEFCKYIYIFIQVARQLPLYFSKDSLTNLESIFF